MIRIPFIAVLISTVGILGSNPGSNVAEIPSAAPDINEQDGHARMLALLEKIRQNMDQENVYVGEGVLRDTEPKLAEVEVDQSIEITEGEDTYRKTPRTQFSFQTMH